MKIDQRVPTKLTKGQKEKAKRLSIKFFGTENLSALFRYFIEKTEE